MRTIICLLLAVVTVSATALLACGPSRKTMNGVIGLDKAHIIQRLGQPTTSWKDPKTDGCVLVYSKAAMVMGPYADVRQPAPRPLVFRKTRLIYLDKDSICRSWKRF